MAVGDQLYRLRGHGFVVDGVGADEILAVPGLECGIVDDGQELGQNARVVARSKRPVGARLGAQLGPRSGHSRGKQRVQRVGAGVGAQQHRPVILLFDQRSLAQFGQRSDERDDVLLEFIGAVEIAQCHAAGPIGAIETHAVVGLRAHAEGL